VRTIGVVLCVVLAVGAVAVAQDAGQGILLRYKFEPTQKLTYGVSGTGQGQFRIDGIPQAPPPADMWMEGSATIGLETQSVDEQGVGQVKLTLADAFGKMQVFGEVMEVQYQDGRLVLSQAGNVMLDTANPGEAAEGMPGLDQMTQLIELFNENGLILQIAPDGKLVGLPQLALLPEEMTKALIPGMDIKEMLKNSRASLPENPVKVGDTWEVRETVPFAVGEGEKPVETVTKYTFAAIEDVEGRPCARIVATSDVDLEGLKMTPALMGPMGPPGAEMLQMEFRTAKFSVQQTEHFDYERGVSLRSSADIGIDMTIHENITVPTEQGEAQVAFDITMQDLKLTFSASLLE
jgi:hypothetical protein